MFNKELSVVVKCGYIDVASTGDPQVCAQVLALLAQHGISNPETPEQRLLRELEDKVSTAQSREYDQRVRADRLEKKLAEIAGADKQPKEAERRAAPVIVGTTEIPI